MEWKHLRQRQPGCKGSEAELAQRVQGKAQSSWSRGGRRRVVRDEMEGRAGRPAGGKGCLDGHFKYFDFSSCGLEAFGEF